MKLHKMTDLTAISVQNTSSFLRVPTDSFWPRTTGKFTAEFRSHVIYEPIYLLGLSVAIILVMSWFQNLFKE
jgi:hypothetical protein